MRTNNSKEKVRQLQNILYLTAKKCDSRRFHALYDKVYRDDVLFEAWKRVKANKGSSGVDGVKIEDVEAMGIEKYLSEIKSELMNGKYKPFDIDLHTEGNIQIKCPKCRSIVKVKMHKQEIHTEQIGI